MNFFVLLNIKEDILENDPKQFLVPIDSNRVFFSYYGSHGGPATVWLPVLFQIICFCVQQQKESHTGLEQQQNFHFWVNYSSKAA